MSSSKGNMGRKRPQKHQNRTAFKNDLHDTSHKTKKINSMEIHGLCNRCKNIIEWKIKYKKYKPLTAPRKCVNCEQKAIKYAYHMLCSKCAIDKNVCAKCCKPVENEEHYEDHPNADIKAMLKNLPERKRRTILRFISKQQDSQQEISPELLSQVEDMVSKLNTISFEEDSFLSDEIFSDDDDDDE